MRIDHFRGLILVFVVEVGDHAPTNESDKQDSSGHSEPAHWKEPQSKFGARGGGKTRTNLAAERNGRGLVKLGSLECGPQSLLRFESCEPLRAGFQVALKFGSAGGVEFPVEIAVKNGVRVLTAHGMPPGERPASGPAGGAGAHVRGRT